MSDFQNKISNETIDTYTSGTKKIDVSIGQYFSQGWEIFQKNMGGNLLNGVVLLFLGIIRPFMESGYFMGLYEERSGGKPMEMGQMFKGFDLAGKIVWQYLAQIIVGLVMGMVTLPFLFIAIFAAGNNEGLALIGMGMFYIILLLMTVLIYAVLLYSVFLMTFSQLEGMDAVKASLAIAKKNFGKSFMFALILIILNIGGAMLCYVGAFVTLPVGVIATYLFCNDIFKAEQDIDTNPINHLV